MSPVPPYIQGAVRWLTWWLTHGRADLATPENLAQRIGEAVPGLFDQAMRITVTSLQSVQRMASMPSQFPLWAAELTGPLPSVSEPAFLARLERMAREQDVETTGYVDVRVAVTWITQSGQERVSPIDVLMSRGSTRTEARLLALEAAHQWLPPSGGGVLDVEVMAPFPGLPE